MSFALNPYLDAYAARPGHLIQHRAASGPPDEPGDDVEGKHQVDAAISGVT
jgi:hypothetical protein